MICSPLTEWRWLWVTSRILSPPGVIARAPMTLILAWWVMLVRIVGVLPRGDQDRLSGDTRENPLSSSKTRVAPRSRDFFYPGP